MEVKADEVRKRVVVSVNKKHPRSFDVILCDLCIGQIFLVKNGDWMSLDDDTVTPSPSKERVIDDIFASAWASYQFYKRAFECTLEVA